MDPTAHDHLLEIIRSVRRRWRLKLALRGVAATVACAAAALILAAWGLQWMRFTPESILLSRIAIAVLFVVLASVLLARPLMRRVTDEQIALYLEEHEPSLDAAIISAVENGGAGSGIGQQSPALLRRLIETAIDKCRAVDEGRRVERAPMRRYAGSLAAVVVVAGAAFLFGPAYMRHALSALLVFSRSVEAAAPYRIDVKPGHATVPRGADQTISAHLVGLPGRPGVADDPQVADRRVRAAAADPRRERHATTARSST